MKSFSLLISCCAIWIFILFPGIKEKRLYEKREPFYFSIDSIQNVIIKLQDKALIQIKSDSFYVINREIYSNMDKKELLQIKLESLK